MKITQYKIFYFTLTVIFVFCINKNCSSQWVASGLSGTTVYSISSDGSNMFSGTYQRVYQYNGGSSWSVSYSIINNIYFRAVAVNANYIYAGTDSPFAWGLYYSTNTGANWIHAPITAAYNVHSLAVNGSNVFCGDDNGIFRSTNNGGSWTNHYLANGYIQALAVKNDTIFAGVSSNYGVYISVNNGTNWAQTSLNNQAVNSLAINGNLIFAGTNNNGVYLSTNNGTNWSQTSLNFLTVQALIINGTNIFAGTSLNGVLVSNNNGTSWIARNEGLGSVANILTLSIFSNYIYAGTGGSGVYRRPLTDFLGINPLSNEIPEKYSLGQNFPNPFNPSTKIQFSIPQVGDAFMHSVQMIVFDALGSEIQTLVNEELKPGEYEVTFDGSNLSSGVYFYKITSGEYTNTKKMILLK